MRREARWGAMRERAADIEEERLAARTPCADAPERRRQEAVDRSKIVRRRSAPLQPIVEAAARDYRVPIALISIIDRRREYFAARTGIEREEAPREDALRLHVVKCPEPRPAAPSWFSLIRLAREAERIIDR